MLHTHWPAALSTQNQKLVRMHQLTESYGFAYCIISIACLVPRLASYQKTYFMTCNDTWWSVTSHFIPANVLRKPTNTYINLHIWPYSGSTCSFSDLVVSHNLSTCKLITANDYNSGYHYLLALFISFIKTSYEGLTDCQQKFTATTPCLQAQSSKCTKTWQSAVGFEYEKKT